ncbi:SurA N-terminal domain-containing protein [Methylomonas rhizoryzae]|uniref:SurA N-terminal domain-containing protein n=1 Tax=Methylomonas rhizoryzae TaxID=2608981 RepID=UPI0012328F5D|nr:SurA N-terminal domain-containing protein [Methylomonas rhizoryzae]
MLLEIREKVQGVFATIILVFICVLFGLWGIQNYLGGGKEAPVITVGDKEFFQRDVNQAYRQFEQNLAGMKFDEETLKQQVVEKLIRDEVLLQYAESQKLTVTDDVARDFVQSLEYFQKDGKFDKSQYQTLLNAQGMSSDEFVRRIKKALIMEQVQRGIVDSGFVTPAEIESFFKIQNQQRDVEYVTLPLKVDATQPTEEDVNAYYQQHLDRFQTEEQVAIQYVELALSKLAADVKATDDELKAFYEEQKAQYTTPERRKISHILFAFGKDGNQSEALQRAQRAKQELAGKDFASLAAEVSDDKLTAKNGGDLGLFNVGVMEKDFEEAASRLKQGEVSDPVKSAFGYHLIKVTELVAGEIKPFATVKSELLPAYQKAQAESRYNELAEKLAEVSYENPGSLEAVAQLLGVEIQTTPLFTRVRGEGIAANDKVRQATFSEDVLKGNNSEPLELAGDQVVVLRMLSHNPAATKDLNSVKDQVIEALLNERAGLRVTELADSLKKELQSGKSFTEVAQAAGLTVKKLSSVTRTAKDIDPGLVQAVFRAAKPQANQASVVVIDNVGGSKTVAAISRVIEGAMTEADKAQQAGLAKNMAAAFGRAQFEAVLNQLETEADLTVAKP